jgi:hypothetical protein
MGTFTDVFVMNLYPYASVHVGPEGMLGGEARGRVAGFWQALGILPPSEPDHLGTLLGLLAELVERESDEEEPAARLLLGRARAALLREHLEPWLPAFLGRVKELGGAYYAAWADLLMDALRHEASRGRELPSDRERTAQVEMPLHLRRVPGVPDPRAGEEGRAAGATGWKVGGTGAGGRGGPDRETVGTTPTGEDFLKALLAPVRSGMILTRSDLVRAGRELGLGTRMGERLYTLKAFLGQDPSSTLSWLAGEARRQASLHGEIEGFDEGVLAFWSERAAATARLLDELASVEVGMNNGDTDHG